MYESRKGANVIFPKDFNVNDVITTSLKTEVSHANHVGRDIKFDFNKRKFVFIDGANVENSQIDAICQWVELFIRTEAQKFKIYSDSFGTNLNGLIGYRLPRSFVVSEIERRITEGIINKLPCIEAVKDWDFNAGVFEFTIVTNTGEERRLKREIQI